MQIKTALLFLIIIGLASPKLIYLFSFLRHGANYPKNELYDGK